MKNSNVEINQTYWAKVSGRNVKIRITSINPEGGWNAINLNTGRKARIKSIVNLDEIIEGRNVYADRKLAFEREAEKSAEAIAIKETKETKAIKKPDSILNSTHYKIKAKETNLKKAIAKYLKVKESAIKAIITTPEYNYEVDLKNGELYEVTLEELAEQNKKQNESKLAVVSKEKTSKRKPLNIAPKLKENIKSIRVGTKQEKIANLLINGATINDLIKATGWTKASCKGALHEDMHNRKGYGVKQDSDKYYLVFPEGLNSLVLSGI